MRRCAPVPTYFQLRKNVPLLISLFCENNDDDILMLNWGKAKGGIILVFILAFLFLAADGPRIIQFPPRSTHIFRQSDCLAYTKTYYQRHSGFFTPAGYNLIGKGGRVVSEFPILYYISAQLCRLFGFHYWIIRGVTMLCYIIGLYYLLLCCRLWIKDLFLALFPVIILASTPYYFFYAVNYLPNIPAISFSFAGLYYMLRHAQSNAPRHVAISSIFFTLACLLKPTDGGLIWLAYLATACTVFIKGENRNKRVFPLLVSAGFIVFCAFLWYLFVKWYNAVNGNNINLQGLYPIWEMGRDDMARTFQFRILSSGREVFQHIILLLLLVSFLIIYIVKWKSLNPFLRIFTMWLIIGAAIYTPLWFKAFLIHDYYQLIFTIPAVFLCITIINWYENTTAWPSGRYSRYVVKGVLAVLLIISIYHNQAIQLNRYADSNMAVNNPAIYELEPYLRKIGISEADSVLSVPDFSPNITLAIFGNPGYASDLFGPGIFNAGYCKAHNIKYMIITDARYIHDPAYKPYTSKLIGEFKGIHIYNIQ